MDNCNKTTPYVELELDNLTILFTVDTGCSANILNIDTYKKIKHLELSNESKEYSVTSFFNTGIYKCNST